MAATTKKTSAKPAARSVRTKKDIILGLLRRKNGASIEDLIKSTGWQAHSVRGFLSGTVAKKMGLSLTSVPDKNGGRRYAINP